ncbi:MAG: FAD-dependent thymidylate synthase [Patescibacteria group bacterium]|jgi:thymidylate synthase (FAD)
MKNTVKLLAVKTAKPELLDATGQPIDQLKLVELAGRTCYKSQDKISDDSARRFVGALIKSGHEAMIEFSWLTFKLPKTDSERLTGSERLKEWLIEVLKSGACVQVTEEKKHFLISGNFRSFRDLLRTISLDYRDYIESIAIYLDLAVHYPEIVEGEIENRAQQEILNDNKSKFCYWHCYCVEHGFYNISESPLTDQEKLKHYWAAARFVGSRAFTHQLVRHRRSSFAQESQRYCDERGFIENGYFIVPPSIVEAELSDLYLTQLQESNLMYQKLLGSMERMGLKGKKLKEDARFILPNAVASEICMAGNLEQWFRVFKLRLDSHAQWEIRGVIEEFQHQLFAAIPEAERLYENF